MDSFLCFSAACRSNQLWLSGSRLGNGNTFIWMASGKLIVYNRYASGQPTNNWSNNCLKMNGYYWYNDDCNAKRNFICESLSDESCSK